MTRILHGDCREVLATLPADSVHCAVTSPPYWGLRDYGTASWEGGDAGCDHLGPPMRTNNKPADSSSTFHGGTTRANEFFRDICGKCGARRIDRQLGLEATPEEYVANMVEVFRGVRRVLRPDGVCFLNLGDSYAANRSYQVTDNKHTDVGNNGAMRVPNGLKPKDLVGIPWRVAFALQAEGWYLRSDIIWSKPNPMPESVTDRPTKAHEYIFLLTKSARYFWDQEAVREPAINTGRIVNYDGSQKNCGSGDDTNDFRTRIKRPVQVDSGRNIRSVWTIATSPFAQAHFATFPPKLAETCIKAGTSERGCCPSCGAPWVRVMDVARDGRTFDREQNLAQTSGASNRTINGVVPSFRPPKKTTTGFRPACLCAGQNGHPLSPVPCTVLDPFSGAGTTVLVADRLQRNGIGIELNPEYVEMAAARLSDDSPLFGGVE